MGRQVKGLTMQQSAEFMNVSVSSVEKAAYVLRNGVPELQALVMAGKANLSECRKVCDLPPEKQIELVRSVELGELKRLRDGLTLDREAERMQTLVKAWNACSDDQRSLFIRTVTAA